MGIHKCRYCNTNEVQLFKGKWICTNPCCSIGKENMKILDDVYIGIPVHKICIEGTTKRTKYKSFRKNELLVHSKLYKKIIK